MKLVNNTLFAAQIGLVGRSGPLAERLGVDEVDAAGGAAARQWRQPGAGAVAAAGSAEVFIAAVGEFIGKDVAVVRATVAELGGDLGVLDDVVDAGG